MCVFENGIYILCKSCQTYPMGDYASVLVSDILGVVETKLEKRRKNPLLVSFCVGVETCHISSIYLKAQFTAVFLVTVCT